MFLIYFQVANAANYGAIAAIIYSDPADYAQQGGEPENTYPNTAWLPASGVQRGSLYTMPGSGDPQTPGIAALVGMFRRSLNDSELPPIPAHPMGYGDAVHFLKRIKGNICFQLVALFLFLFLQSRGHNRDMNDTFKTRKKNLWHPGCPAQ